MFQANSRIEQFKGIRFYEQDILYDDYVYNNDIEIVMDIDYMSPGIGIALMNNEGLTLQEQKDVYLFKLGYNESSIIFRDKNITKKLMSTAIAFTPPAEGMKFIFSKTGALITVSVDGYGKLIEYNLASDMDKYSIGIYSNAGNIIKSISVASSIPDYWTVNMRNTNGGYLDFFKNGFSLKNCENYAEIEQPNISLDAGEYFMKYTIDEGADIKCYVMLSNDERLYDDEKNLLDNNNRFVLSESDQINIKFKGKVGSAKNIHLIDQMDDKYVATKDEQATIEGSYISIDTSGLSMVKWSGTIIDAPLDTNPNEIASAIMTNGYESVSSSVPGVLFQKEYNYEYNVTANTLSIFNGTTLASPIHTFVYGSDDIVIFKNMDAIITQLSLIQKDGEVINLIVEKTSKQYVPASITSPIIVVDSEGIPLDLSSSYRIVDTGKMTKYIFTNYEREIFSPETHITLSKYMSMNTGSLKIYGIPKNVTIDYDSLYKIPEAGMDTINLFCENAVLIKEKDLHFIDKSNGDIYFENVDDYQLLVTDYLKKNSYCINYVSNLQMYEVDISTEDDNTSLIYDHESEETYEDMVINQINNYRMTTIIPTEKNYIVLRREI